VNPGIEIVNVLDPKCQELEVLGYVVIGESWGAHLKLTDPLDLSLFSGKISKLESEGFRLEVLELGQADLVLELELTTNDDYPYTPATSHLLPTLESTRSLWDLGHWVYGAFKYDALVGVGATSRKRNETSIDFGSVRKEYRGLGVGSAIASLAISRHVNLGERFFSTGGAAINEASQATVRSLGFVIDEQWRSYERPS
jgi:ribosomal protein S18 acetylase RimI-like enzyme